MNEAERAVARAFGEVQLSLRDYYIYMRTHGLSEDDEVAKKIAANLKDWFDDDAELILSAHIAVNGKSEGE